MTADEQWWSAMLKRKGHISPVALTALIIGALVPLLLAASRLAAQPGAGSLPWGLDWLASLGALLNDHVTFRWVPPTDRPALLFLLLLPVGALLVVVFRLTFGIRVLGLRAILLAIGFQAIGVLPSLSLLLLMVGIILLVRPWIRRIKLPMYARLTFVLCLAVTVMIGAALAAPWIGSAGLWSVAFFPVIIMAMIGEAVARTLEQDDAVMAIWRGFWTVALALLLALIDGPASQLAFRSPELIVTQLLAIILVAELWDLRLLEQVPGRLSRRFKIGPVGPRIVLVCNPPRASATARSLDHGEGVQQSVQAHVDALVSQGFAVNVLECNGKLVGQLARLMPPDEHRGMPGGIVFNLATGQDGEGRHAHVPAMLEMAGIPFTGTGLVALARMSDRFVLLGLLRHAGVPAPRHHLVLQPRTLELDLPAAVQPRMGPDARRIIVRDRRALRQAIKRVAAATGQAVLVEEVARGRSFSVAIIGNSSLECLPLLERRRGEGRVCPANVDEATERRIRECACAAFWAAGCRDYARIDIRLTKAGEPIVVDVRGVGLFARRGSFVTAAAAAGYDMGTVMRRIVSESARRYLVVSGGEGDNVVSGPVISFLDRKALAG